MGLLRCNKVSCVRWFIFARTARIKHNYTESAATVFSCFTSLYFIAHCASAPSQATATFFFSERDSQDVLRFKRTIYRASFSSFRLVFFIKATRKCFVALYVCHRN